MKRQCDRTLGASAGGWSCACGREHPGAHAFCDACYQDKPAGEVNDGRLAELRACLERIPDGDAGDRARRLLLTCVRNIVADPGDKCFRRMKVSNKQVGAMLAVDGTEAFLRALGFERAEVAVAWRGAMAPLGDHPREAVLRMPACDAGRLALLAGARQLLEVTKAR